MAEPAAPRRRRAERLPPIVAIVGGLIVFVGALAFGSRPTPASTASPVASTVAAAPSAIVPESTAPGSSGVIVQPSQPPLLHGGVPNVGSVAAVGPSGAVSLIAPDGRSIAVTDPAATTVGFPAWSPRGDRIALIEAADSSATIEVLTVDPVAATAAAPIPIYRSATEPAFYLSWVPDGAAVSFLANDDATVSLRIASADGQDPLDGTGPASLVRKGAPLYFDWIDPKRLVLHVGIGSEAFLGEVDRTGAESSEPVARPGLFRSADVSADGRFVGYVRADGDTGDIVVAERDGQGERATPVAGPSAVVFNPAGDTLASIGAIDAGQADLGFPYGPLRLIDAATGQVRVLLDGSVVAFFWSPDGRTIAALRIQPPSGSTASAPFSLTAADTGAASPTAASPTAAPSEVHLVFVDAATGTVRSDEITSPASRLVRELLPYFDQYALSHRLWAPDGSAFLIPTTAEDGQSHVVAVPPDGGPARFTIDAEVAFWSP